MKRVMTIFVIAVVMVLTSALAYAHSGRTDAQGCHYNKTTGVKHCH